MENKKYELKDKIIVIGTGKDEDNFPKDEEREVHPRVANKLIKKGVAVAKKDK